MAVARRAIGCSLQQQRAQRTANTGDKLGYVTHLPQSGMTRHRSFISERVRVPVGDRIDIVSLVQIAVV